MDTPTYTIESIETLKDQVRSMSAKIEAHDDAPCGLSIVPAGDPCIDDFVEQNEQLCEALRSERQHSAGLQATIDEMLEALRRQAA